MAVVNIKSMEVSVTPAIKCNKFFKNDLTMTASWFHFGLVVGRLVVPLVGKWWLKVRCKLETHAIIKSLYTSLLVIT